MRACPLLLGFVAAACNSSSSDRGAALVAAATIGPDGGSIEVAAGTHAGLRLDIPAGALAEATEIRIRDGSVVVPPGAAATSQGPNLATPFFFEPSGLVLGERATLRAPYRVIQVQEGAPGNVLVRELRRGNQIDHLPVAVDVIQGLVEVPIRHLTWYQIVPGPQPAGLTAYWQQPGAPVALADGWSFAVEEVPPESPFALAGAYRWRLTGPQGDDLLYFAADQLVGREAILGNWRETWSQPCAVWTRAGEAVPGSATFPMQVSQLPLGASFGAQMTAYGLWNWTVPREIAGTLLYDLIQLRVVLAWSRQDLGVGQREYRFTFAPGRGLVALAQDGVEHVRTSL